MKQILIQDYSPDWAKAFEMLKAVYIKHLDIKPKDIQHVGSTSVVGLAAKPVIDIDLIIDDRSLLQAMIKNLAALGYEHAGDMGIRDREAFKRSSTYVQEDGTRKEWPLHNLYVCLNGSVALRNHLALRDYLRTNPDMVKQYGDLKKSLVAENPFDIDLYIKNKTPFITGILAKMGFAESELEGIRKDNGAV